MLHRSKIKQLTISPQHLQTLKQMAPGTSRLLMVNHINFVDPHIMVELSYKANFAAKWLAGIEPFDTARGLFGWHIQRAGAFSIDRGILDKTSLETAQSILDEGQVPFIIYPEGEAAYTNKILQTFYPGAALFALSTAEKLRSSPQPVEIIPIGVSYRFVGPADAEIQHAIVDLHHSIQSAAAQQRLEMNLRAIETTMPLWRQITALLHTGISFLEVSYPHYSADSCAPLPHRMEALKNHLLNILHREHQDQPAPQDLSLDELMMLKNKLRSIIARKQHAPPVQTLEKAITRAEILKTKAQKGKLGLLDQKRLTHLETQWIGISKPEKELEKRLKTLLRHLKQQVSYAGIRAQATPEDMIRWEGQINDTRRIKLLALLMADLIRQDETPEGLDGILVKLEILLFSQFIHRGPKEAVVRLGDPIDVKAFLAEHEGLSRKQLQETLTLTVRDKIQSLLVFSQARPQSPKEKPLSVL